LALILIVFVAPSPARLSLAVLHGAQDLTFLARIQIVAWAAGTATSVLLVMTGGGILSLAGGWAVTTALPALAALRRASRIYPAVPIQAAISSSRPYFQRSVWVSVGQIAQVLLNGSDVLVLGFVLGPAAVVAYSCTGKLVTVFANHPYMLMHGSQPAISELRGAGARDQLIRATTALTQAMLMMSGALVAVILPANLAFVSWWVGPAQYGGWTLSVAFAAMMLMRHCNVAVIYTLFCFGYERQLSLTSLADGVVCVAGAMVLIPWLGAAGAPLASVLGVMLVSLPLNLRGVARELGLSVAEFLAPSAELLKRLAIGTVAAAAAAYWLPGQSIVFSVMAMACVAGGYVLLIAPIAWNGPAGPYARTVLSAAQDRFACLARVEPALDRWLRPAGAGQP
ncbi:MAG: lipopolysaccharide biosynthesis protein, partial [Vicinamibacterales bacterium]